MPVMKYKDPVTGEIKKVNAPAVGYATPEYVDSAIQTAIQTAIQNTWGASY